MPSQALVITRRHLKDACDAKRWDLLDRLLELDPTHLDDNALYGDGDGDHWGLLVECIRQREVDGVVVLLARGADPSVGLWGDGASRTPLEVAEGQAVMEALLRSDERPVWRRATEPALPAPTTESDALERAAAVRAEAGVVFDEAALRSRG